MIVTLLVLLLFQLFLFFLQQANMELEDSNFSALIMVHATLF